MGKETRRIETQSQELTRREAEAYEIAEGIRKAFSSREVEAIRRELESDEED